MSVVLTETQLTLRRMQLTDLSTVIATEVIAYPFPWTQKIFSDCLQVGYDAWVVENNEQLIGYGLMSVAIGEAHILNLCIHPQWQQRGYGKQLLYFLLEQAKEKQVDTVFLEVRVSNHIAISLYHKMGFNQIGVRRSYYPNGPHQREHALIFALTL